ncbi:MAG TPA: PhzF family phenazine biosynthesis protein [Steroidobacteraceae bacterium]|nr:PhzF family phenazine biosynthesis protein [Steroidobacteraceae bacterium]
MAQRYITLDVFTDRRFGGNPLAVFCDQPELPAPLMQTIAREFNLSETVFILPPTDARALRRLRIFAPVAELPFAGHPTIGAAHVLVESGIATGDRFTLELGVGLVPITVTRRAQTPPFLQLTSAQLPEKRDAVATRAQLAQLLSLNEQDILSDRDFAQQYSCGVPYLFVPVRDRAVLARAQPDLGACQRLLGSAWAQMAFVFCRDPELPGSHIRARMFAPTMGVFEDPATGSAAAALAGYLGDRDATATGTLRWVVEQGFEMGRPSIIHVEAEKANGVVTVVKVGGTAVRVSEGNLLTA